MDSPAAAFNRILEVLDRLEIAYFITGSVASSSYGFTRTTNDIDIVACLRADQVESLAAELQPDFYADPEMMKDGVRRGRGFNLIHLATSHKIDIFPLGDDAFSQAAFARRRYDTAKSVGGEPVECALASAEDIILSKLRWYRADGEVSDMQWHDLRGIIEVRGPQLDRDYLHLWAGRLGVADLERLLTPGPQGSNR